MIDRSTIVITGVGGGIGSAVASRLSSGNRLVLADVNASGLDEVAGGIDGDVEVVVGDLCSAVDVDRLVTAAGDHVVGLVNVAGIGPVQTDNAIRILDVNLRSVAMVVERLLPQMAAGAAIVSIGSVASARAAADADDILADPLDDRWNSSWTKRAPDTWAAYAYSKRGLLLYTRRKAVELARAGVGVRVNIVAPSQTATPLGKASIKDNPEIAAFVSRIPMGRMAEPSEVAHAVAFLLSDQASFITGIELFVDGGAGAAGASMTVPT